MPKVDLDKVKQEAAAITGVFQALLPSLLDGRTEIQTMKAAEELSEINTQWRQTEWIGWWFEFFVASDMVRNVIKAQQGPAYGHTRFDIQKDYVWDLKVHVANKTGDIILNDCEAIDACHEDRGGVGFIIVFGIADFDTGGEFKAWHDALKQADAGGPSDYVMAGLAAGRRSRPRKVSFRPTMIQTLFLHDPSPEADAKGANGILGYFQKGMVNSDGSARRAKYKIRSRSKALEKRWLLSMKAQWPDDPLDL